MSHPADLLVIAGADVPDDLAPLDPKAGSLVPALLRHAGALPPAGRDALSALIASLPQRPRDAPYPPPRAFERYPPGPGGLLMRLVRNRNLGWAATAQTFLLVTGRYWSAATYGGVGRGTVPLTPDLQSDFAAVLGIPVDRLAATTGVPAAPPNPAPAWMAELIWDARRLSAAQLRRLARAG
uniref:hypothetical protein n=1 Tax=Herbidospora sakaeratensis TaxID=564415 RepID=UPI0007803211|nr:hypothetical protein [Herbidospora sakaeratensis]